MTRIFFAHGGAERNFDFWILNVELLRLAAMWNWPMMNFDALTRCFEHEIFEHGCHHEFFWTRITRMTRIFLFGTRISLTDLCSRRGAHMGGTRFLNTDVTLFFLNTNNSDNTNIFLAHGSHSIFFWTRDSPWVHWPKASNYADNTIFFLHTDLTDLTDLCSRRGAHSFLNTRFAVGPLTEGR